MMVEIPSNVILLPEFAEYFDGFSIGSNDLTQLTLGVDRDSEIVAHVFDERDPAVRTLIAQAIQHARRLGRKIGLCGQAPSDYPEFARFLVECGIDSMSLNPDAVLPTTRLVAEVEQQQCGPCAARLEESTMRPAAPVDSWCRRGNFCRRAPRARWAAGSAGRGPRPCQSRGHYADRQRAGGIATTRSGRSDPARSGPPPPGQ